MTLSDVRVKYGCSCSYSAFTPKATWETAATGRHSFSMYAGNEEERPERPAAWATRFQRRDQRERHDVSNESWRTLNFIQISIGATAATANWGLIWIPKAEKGGKLNQREENNGWETYNCGLRCPGTIWRQPFLSTETTEKTRLEEGCRRCGTVWWVVA